MWRITLIILIAGILVADVFAVKVIEFGAERKEGNVFEIQPNEVTQIFADFSICLRCRFWTWDFKVLFGTSFMSLVIFPPEPGFPDAYLVLNGSVGATFDFEDMKVSPTIWNSFCLTYNSSNSSILLALNSGSRQSKKSHHDW